MKVAISGLSSTKSNKKWTFSSSHLYFLSSITRIQSSDIGAFFYCLFLYFKSIIQLIDSETI